MDRPSSPEIKRQFDTPDLPKSAEGGFDNELPQSGRPQSINEQSASDSTQRPAVEMPVAADQQPAIDHRVIPEDNRTVDAIEDDMKKRLTEDHEEDYEDLLKDVLTLSDEHQNLAKQTIIP